jgi:hypothetical protein
VEVVGLSDHAAGSGMSLAIPDEVIERIAERAAELLAERQGPAEPELLTVAEAAEYLRCKPQGLYDLKSRATPAREGRSPRAHSSG